VDYRIALIDAKPIIIVLGANADVSDHRAMAYSKSRSRVPDYSPSVVAFAHIAGRTPWFGIFARASGGAHTIHLSRRSDYLK